MGDRIVVIGAHPDDYEIGVGMLILKNVASGHSVFGVIASHGEMSSPTGQSRAYEGAEAAKLLGLTCLYQLDHPDTKMHNTYDSLFSDLECIMNEIKPSQVFVHAPADRHLDHQTVANAAHSAARKVVELYGYLSPSTHSDALGTFNQFFVGDDALMRKKISILRDAYASQVEKDGIVDPDRIFAESQFFGGRMLPYMRPIALVEPLSPLRSRYVVSTNGSDYGWGSSK